MMKKRWLQIGWVVSAMVSGVSSEALAGGVCTKCCQKPEMGSGEMEERGPWTDPGIEQKSKKPEKEWVAGRYVTRVDGSFVDEKTGLVWQADPGVQLPWGKAQAYCAELEPKGKWHVPTIKELESVIDRRAPGKPKTSLPGMRSNWYWSSTREKEGYMGVNWWSELGKQVTIKPFYGGSFHVGFFDGTVNGYYNLYISFQVRCVRVAEDGPY